MIIEALEDGTFSFSKKSLYKKQAEKDEEEKRGKAELKNVTDYIIKYFIGGINKKVFKEYFDYKVPTAMLKDLVNS